MTIQKTNNYDEIALNRLRYQSKNKPNIETIVTIYAKQIQELEELFFDLLEKRSLASADGEPLDVIGKIINLSRNNLDDSTYRVRILAKIAENISDGTPEELINLYKILMQANYVEIFESFPAEVSLTAVDAKPLGSMQEIRHALQRAKSGGIQLLYLSESKKYFFTFAEDPDPNGRGFDDFNNPGNGGYFTEILSAPPMLAFENDNSQFTTGFGDMNDPSIGGEFFKITL